MIDAKGSAFLVVGLLLFTSFISIAGGQGTHSNIICEPCETTDRYELFNRTYFVFGKLAVNETFTTPMDCQIIHISIRAFRYFTGQSHVRLYDEEKPKLYLSADSPVFLIGSAILPGMGWFDDDNFTPGNQTLELRAWGFGKFTQIIGGIS